MKTNIDLNENLVTEAFKYTSVSTKKELINTVLKEFIENHSKKNLLDLKGKISFQKDYNHRAMRN